MPLMCSSLSIADVIREKCIITHFQPIVSVIKKSIIGLEGLSRGVYPESGELVPPNILFRLAADSGLTVELDRLCREKALECFAELFRDHPDFLLFLNIDASVIDKANGSNHLVNAVNNLNLPPQNIVIEINESKVSNMDRMKEFIARYRKYGFLISLDDVGSGFSNLDRIPLTQPDILKVDRGLVKDIDKQYHKQEVFKSLVNLSKKIGTLVVAEGIETEEEANAALELGADMLQGFFFSRPVKVEAGHLHSLNKNIHTFAGQFKIHMENKIKEEKLRNNIYDGIIDSIMERLIKSDSGYLSDALEQIAQDFATVECLYILDEWGIQIGETVCSPGARGHRGSIFQPAAAGEDHSLKKYYYTLVNTGSHRYLTSPYISLATGNLCVTASATFRDAGGKMFILCVDFNQGFFV